MISLSIARRALNDDKEQTEMANNTDWLNLCDEIDDGDFDEGLRDIAKAVSSRLDIVARRNARRLQRSLAIGDKVKLTNGIKPRYYEGMVGHILRVKGELATIQLTKMPKASGAGRPPAEGYSDKVNVEFQYLVKLDASVRDLGEVDDAADIGDDSDDELDD